jgi:hypothetical protein
MYSYLYDLWRMEWNFRVLKSHRYRFCIKHKKSEDILVTTKGQFVFNGYSIATAYADFSLEGRSFWVRIEWNKIQDTITFRVDWNQKEPPFEDFDVDEGGATQITIGTSFYAHQIISTKHEFSIRAYRDSTIRRPFNDRVPLVEPFLDLTPTK